MGKIIFEGKEEQVEDGKSINKACEKLGVTFGCYSGMCGACEIEVLEGDENLSEFTEEEENIGIHKPKRLACMCDLKHGNVKIKF
jgi:ferredoxin